MSEEQNWFSNSEFINPSSCHLEICSGCERKGEFDVMELIQFVGLLCHDCVDQRANKEPSYET